MWQERTFPLSLKKDIGNNFHQGYDICYKLNYLNHINIYFLKTELFHILDKLSNLKLI